MDARFVRADGLERLQEQLRLVDRLLDESGPPERRRDWLVDYCRRTGAEERQLWQAVARYRQAGAAGLLEEGTPRGTVFDRQGRWVREGILTRLVGSPVCVLEEFRQLARFVELLADRLQYLCDWVLEFFLDPDPWVALDPYEVGLALEVLQQKLREELEYFAEILYSERSLAEILTDYHDWLCRRAVAGERGDVI